MLLPLLTVQSVLINEEKPKYLISERPDTLKASKVVKPLSMLQIPRLMYSVCNNIQRP